VSSRRGAECVSDLGGPRTAQIATAIVTATTKYRMQLLTGWKMRESFHFSQLRLEIFAVKQIDYGSNYGPHGRTLISPAVSIAPECCGLMSPRHKSGYVATGSVSSGTVAQNSLTWDIMSTVANQAREICQ
jgi:hypothetical protein